MLSLLEELKNNFEVKQLNTTPECTRIATEWFDTHNKAVKAVIKQLQELGYSAITLPHLPVPYIINYQGQYKGMINLIKEEL